MEKVSSLQDQINMTGFDQRLLQGDSDAWELLLKHVHKRIKARSLSIPRGMNHQEAVDEYTSIACNHIVHELAGFQRQGLLSAYIDRLIRTAIANQHVKKMMGAVTRFLKTVDKLSSLDRKQLFEIIRELPSGDHALLLDFIEGRVTAWPDWRQQRLWYDARRELLYSQGFNQLLRRLASEQHRQAATLLDWQKALNASDWSSTDLLEEDDEPELERIPDLDLTPLEVMLQREKNQSLLECLGKLRQSSNAQYRAIERRYVHEESYAQIAATLGASQTAVAKWLERGLKNVRKCYEGRSNGRGE